MRTIGQKKPQERHWSRSTWHSPFASIFLWTFHIRPLLHAYDIPIPLLYLPRLYPMRYDGHYMNHRMNVCYQLTLLRHHAVTAACRCECPLFSIDSIVRACRFRGTVAICAAHKAGFLYSHGPFGRIALSRQCHRYISSKGCNNCESQRKSTVIHCQRKCTDSPYCGSQWTALLYLDRIGISSNESRRPLAIAI
jgi:hypothetical protein